MSEQTPVRLTAYDEVIAAFTDPRLTVPPPEGTGPMAAFRRSVPRFTDGPGHAHLRTAVVAPLATVSPEEIRTHTYERLSAHLHTTTPDAAAGTIATPRTTPHGTTAADAATAGAEPEPRTCTGRRLDLMPLLRTVPVAVLAEALGVPTEQCDAVAVEVAELAPAYPPGAAPPVAARADTAVTRLAALLGADALPTLGCLLAQACDATAALAATTLLANLPRAHVSRQLDDPPNHRPARARHHLDDQLNDRRPGPDAAVRAALAGAAPVRATARTCVAAVTVAGRDLPAGAAVLLSLAPDRTTAPARPVPPEDLAFGHGPHRCPGSVVAVALACGAVAAAWHRTLGGTTAPGTGNLRIPPTLEVIA